MQYTSNGTASCVTANDLDVTTTADPWTHDINGATPLPSVSNLPTQSVYDVDLEDPKGWTYCYGHSDWMPIGDDFVSLWSGSVFDQVYNQCEKTVRARGPVQVVPLASFLLDQTTSYINNDDPKTAQSTTSNTDTTESPRARSSVLADPFKVSSSPTDAPKQTSEDEAAESASATAQAQPPKTSSTNSQSESIQEPATQAEGQSPVSKAQSAATGGSQTSGRENVADTVSQSSKASSLSTRQEPTTNPGAQMSTTDNEAEEHAETAAAKETTAPTTAGPQIDVLTSLIQEVWQHQSSSATSAGQDTAVSPELTDDYGEPAPKSTVATSPEQTIIAAGTTTFKADSDGNFMIGTHTLQAAETPYEEGGVTYSLDTSRSALVINGVSTIAAESSEFVVDVPQATAISHKDSDSTVTSASAKTIEPHTSQSTRIAPAATDMQTSSASHTTVVPFGSQTGALSTTAGVGDYVWTGMAGAISAAGSSASSLDMSSEILGATGNSATISRATSAASSTASDGVGSEPTSMEASGATRSASATVRTADDNKVCYPVSASSEVSATSQTQSDDSSLPSVAASSDVQSGVAGQGYNGSRKAFVIGITMCIVVVA